MMATTTGPVPKKRALKTIKALAPWVVSLGLIAFIVATEDMSEVTRDFAQINVLLFLAVTVPFLMALLLLETVFLLAGFRRIAGAGTFRDLFRARAAAYLLTVISIFVGLGGLIVYGTRVIPVSAFGIGVDQLVIKTLFEPWQPAGTELLLACSGVFTATLILGQALIGVPFIKGVIGDLVEYDPPV